MDKSTASPFFDSQCRALPQYTTVLKHIDTNRKDERIHELGYEIVSGQYLQIQANCPSLNRLPSALHTCRLEPGPRALIASTLPLSYRPTQPPTKLMICCNNRLLTKSDTRIWPI